MSRQNGSEQPGQRTVAELLAEYGGESQRSSRRRRRRAEDPSETAPQAIIDRVMSDSGQMRAVDADGNPVRSESPWTEPGTSRTEVAPPGGGTPGSGAPGSASQPANTPTPGATQGPTQPPVGGAPTADPPQSAAPTAAPQPAQRGEDAAPASGSANFWAQRFAAAGAPPQSPPRQAEPEAPRDDVEATIQQPAMPSGPPAAPPAPPPVPPAQQHVESATEQMAPVPVRPPVDPAEETALVGYPQGYDEYNTGYDDAEYESYDNYAPATDDPYDFDSLDVDEEGYEERDEAAAEPYDAELPAGLDEEHLDDESESEEAPASSGKEWAMVVLQAGAGLLGGIAVWFGFRWLWTEIAVAALVAALIVTGGLVFIARRYLRTDDMQTILFAVLVGLICTVSPAALLLIGQ